jgi:hypothetical protein
MGERFRSNVHALLVFMLFVLIAMPAFKLAYFLSALVIVPIAVAAALIGSFAYLRSDWLPLFVTLAAPAIIVFPSHFLLLSPVSKYLFPTPIQPQNQTSVGNPVPIVLLLFDEFSGISLMDRSGQIDAGRYKNFADLAAISTWYRNASAVHPRTEMAVPSVLSGNYPRGRRPATAVEYPSNLFALLQATGQYQLIAFEPYTRLCRPFATQSGPDRTKTQQFSMLASTLPSVYLQHIFPTDTPLPLPSVPMEWNAVRRMLPERPNSRLGVFRYNWNANRQFQFDELVRRIQPTGEPELYFAHLVLPHFPWCYLPSGETYLPDDAKHGRLPGISSDGESWGSDELALQHAEQRYLLQVGYVDHLLGKAMDQLRAAGLFDSCLLIVTADHGVAFQLGRSRRLPDKQSLPDIASVPLFVKLPYQTSGVISDRNVESIDLLPTIMDVIELADRPATDGTSLVDSTAPERPEKRFYDDGGLTTFPATFPARWRSLERMIQQFGDGSEPERLFRLGPHRELIGQSVQSLEVGDPSKLRVELQYPIIDPIPDKTPQSPCYFSGFVADHAELPVELAISMNGIICAVTRTYSQRRNSNMWCAMLPATAFRTAGENIFQIFAVDSKTSRTTLHPIGEPIGLPSSNGSTSTSIANRKR